MTTHLRDRLQHLARNSQPLTTAALVALWHAGIDTVTDTLHMAGYVRLDDGAWHHPDYLPVASSQSPVISSQTASVPPTTVGRSPSSVSRPLSAPCAPADLLTDIEVSAATRTWLLANVEPCQWPHPHRTSCPDCKLLQPCLSLSRHRQATVCEAVIVQRRLSHANLPDRPDLHRAALRLSPSGQSDLRNLHPAQSAAVAAG